MNFRQLVQRDILLERMKSEALKKSIAEVLVASKKLNAGERLGKKVDIGDLFTIEITLTKLREDAFEENPSK